MAGICFVDVGVRSWRCIRYCSTGTPTSLLLYELHILHSAELRGAGQGAIDKYISIPVPLVL